MNPLYQQLVNGPTQGMSHGPNFLNPIQKVNYIMQAMRNPAAFVKQQFPDIPDGIANDPNQILGYLQQTRGITNQDLQNLYNTYGGR